MLIPEFRADVLSLLQGIDSLLDQFKSTCFTIYIERPQMDDLPEEFGIAFNDLVKSVVQSVEVLLSAARAFFRDIHAVRDHLHKVKFLEGEADKIAGHLLGEIFKSKLPLERKIHVRYFIDMVDNIADEAEDTADKLAIYAIRRAL